MWKLPMLMLAPLLLSCGARVEEVEAPSVIYRQPLAGEQLPVVPAPLGPRPKGAAAALDVAMAKLCEAYSYIVLADPLLRLSAGLEPRAVPTYRECEDAGPAARPTNPAR